jgi:8-oxo-dGTP pyrophosphatase MutT (NUDIX family)
MWFDVENFLASLPEGRVIALAAIDMRIECVPHPFEAENRASIERHWEREKAANPALFNGRMVLPFKASIERGALRGVTRPIDFSTFLFWRRKADNAGGIHIFAHAVPVTRDGAIVAVRMAPHTANPGRVYCAAGSFEPDDFVDGRMDFERNAHREVLEETGIDLGQVRREEGYGILRTGRAVLVFRRYFLDEDGAAVAARIARHIASEDQPEIDAAVLIGRGEKPDNLAMHMGPLIDWHFGEEGRA